MSKRFVDLALFGLLCLVFLISLTWQLSAPALAQAQTQSALGTKTILVLHAFESNVPIFELTDRGLRAILDAGGVSIRNQFFEWLDLGRYPSPEHRKHLVELMRLRYGQRKIDMVITLYPEALQFVLNEGGSIFSDAPILALYLPLGSKAAEDGSPGYPAVLQYRDHGYARDRVEACARRKARLRREWAPSIE